MKKGQKLLTLADGYANRAEKAKMTVVALNAVLTILAAVRKNCAATSTACLPPDFENVRWLNDVLKVSRQDTGVFFKKAA